MPTTPNPDLEQLSKTQKANADLLTAVMRTSFEGMQRLTELNLGIAQEIYTSTIASAGKLATAKDMSEFTRLGQQLAKPERMMDYSRKVYELVAGMQKDVTAVMQANYSQITKNFTSVIDKKKSSVNDGSDVFSGMMKNMMDQTTKAFDHMIALSGQVTEIANANIQAATTASAKAMESVTPIKKHHS